jgi:hypothetical protein
MWTKKKLLIWGKTYPEFSKTYYETVCTGAIDAETGRLLRIYPITLRYMKEPFKAYDWIEAEIERNTGDFRPESYRIRQDTIKVVGHLDHTKVGWAERAKWVLGPANVFTSVEGLQAAEARDHTSLGLVKPKTIVKVYMKYKPKEERQEWEEQRENALTQKELFVDAESKTRDLAFCPVTYRAKFVCDDPACSIEHDLSILDWGLYVLNYNQYADRGAQMAEQNVVEKIEQLMDPTKREPYFYLGNTKAHSHSFMIVGLFHPPIATPPRLKKGSEALKLPGID